MSPRLKLQAAAKPLFLAGALWSAGIATPVAVAGRPQTPPPCGPDGVCVPNPATYGFYSTRWRTFPGDSRDQGPTEAERKAEEAKGDELRGPQPPEMSQEGVLNRTPPKRGGQQGAEPVVPDGNEDIRNLPGLPPLPGPGAGPAEGLAAAPADAPEGAPAGAPAGGALPGLPGGGLPGGTLPGSEPESDPLNPLGGTPTAPPWMSQTMTNPAAAELVPLPYVEQAAPASTAILPAGNVEPLLDGVNLQGDDAPPALPSALQRLSGGRLPVGRATAQAAPAVPAVRTASSATMSQPRSVQPAASGVRQASAVIPVGGQLVNPAGTMGAIAEDQGTQQAIYFEASDAK